MLIGGIETGSLTLSTLWRGRRIGGIETKNLARSTFWRGRRISAKLISGSMAFLGLALLPLETLCRFKKRLDSFCGQDSLVVKESVNEKAIGKESNHIQSR